MLIIMAAFFVYFSYDFYVDFLRGVDTNQTTVENMKDTYGIMVIYCSEIVLAKILAHQG
jgi:hypothetical protein